MDRNIIDYVEKKREEIKEKEGKDPERIISLQYNKRAMQIASKCIKETKKGQQSLTSKIDKIVLNRYFGPIILLGIIYLLYHFSIVQGYKITNYTWPILASFRDLIILILPPKVVFRSVMRP